MAPVTTPVVFVPIPATSDRIFDMMPPRRIATLFGLVLAVAGCRLFKAGSSCSSGPGLASKGIDGSALADGQLSLTLDGGPSGATQAMVDFLYANQLQATFFVSGKGAESFPAVLSSMKDRGHLVANFGYSSEPLKDAHDPVLEVRKTDELISPYVTGDMFILRVPEGELTDDGAKRLNDAGLNRYVGPVKWDFGGQGASDRECWAQGVGVDDCAEKYLKPIRDKRRGIIRLAGDDAQSTELLKVLVPKLREEKFQLIRLDAVPAVRLGLEQSGGKPGTVGGAEGCKEY